MTDYDTEHGVKPAENAPKRIARPDLSTFYSQLDYSSSGNGAYTSPEPDHVAASHLQLADVYRAIERDTEGATSAIIGPLIEELLGNADHPPEQLDGVPDSFLDELERVDKKTLGKADVCPICNNAFLDEQYPLVIRLPCHKDHKFDLECIAPWLKLKRTCPLDRKEIYKKKEPAPAKPVLEDDDDGEWDDMYA